jgi:hypothetical protein
MATLTYQITLTHSSNQIPNPKANGSAHSRFVMWSVYHNLSIPNNVTTSIDSIQFQPNPQPESQLHCQLQVSDQWSISLNLSSTFHIKQLNIHQMTLASVPTKSPTRKPTAPPTLGSLSLTNDNILMYLQMLIPNKWNHIHWSHVVPTKSPTRKPTVAPTRKPTLGK